MQRGGINGQWSISKGVQAFRQKLPTPFYACQKRHARANLLALVRSFERERRGDWSSMNLRYGLNNLKNQLALLASLIVLTVFAVGTTLAQEPLPPQEAA